MTTNQESRLTKAVEGLKYTETQVRRGDVAHEVHNEAIDKVLALIRQTLPEADRKAVGDEKPTFVLPSAYVETAKKHYGDYANIISTADTLIKPSPNLKVEQEHSPKTGTSSNTACVDEEDVARAIARYFCGHRYNDDEYKQSLGCVEAIRPYLRTSLPKPSALTEKERERVVEKIAKALAINLYHSEGLETMNYRGEQDFAEREWRHYEDQAQAALTAIEQLCNLSWKEKSNG